MLQLLCFRGGKSILFYSRDFKPLYCLLCRTIVTCDYGRTIEIFALQKHTAAAKLGGGGGGKIMTDVLIN